MERKGDGFHQRVREGFFKLAKGRKDFVIIDSSNDIEAVHKQIIDIVEKNIF
jgi:thymidylate kinase